MLNHRVAFLPALLLTTLLAITTLPKSAQAFTSGKAGFSIKFKRITSPYKVFATYVLPGESLPIAANGAGTYRLRIAAGKVHRTAPKHWLWRAPTKPGLYPLTIRRTGSSDTIKLNVFVMVPYSRMHNGYLNGYHIGHYPVRLPAAHAAVYKRPRGFIEVTPANMNTRVAPHFRLSQFLCKEPGGFPRYVVLQERLLLKLEMLLSDVNAKGYHANTFTVMSGYRTPAYNHALGNVRLSAHQYGMAADIYIDSRHRGVMDDLNHDGRSDFADAVDLYDMAERVHVEPGGAKLVGGIGKYHSTSAHGPFVHVDVRGFKARWG